MVEPEITRLDLKETKKTVLVVEYNHFADSIGYVYERLNPFLLKRDTEYSVDGVKTIHNRGYDYEWVDNELVLGIAQEQYHQEIPTSIDK